MSTVDTRDFRFLYSALEYKASSSRSLHSCTAEKENSLGICVPVAGGFGVNTCLPIKTVGEGDFSFYAFPRHTDMKGKFVPICADEPFAYIENLQNLHLEFCNGEPGVLVD